MEFMHTPISNRQFQPSMWARWLRCSGRGVLWSSDIWLAHCRGCAQAEHELSNADQLLAFLRRAPDGTLSTSLKDAYPAAMADIARLHKEQKVWLSCCRRRVCLLKDWPSALCQADVKPVHLSAW